MLSAGCMALALSGMIACFTTDGQNIVRLTCSDAGIIGLETCKDQFKRMGASQTNSSFTIVPSGTSITTNHR